MPFVFRLPPYGGGRGERPKIFMLDKTRIPQHIAITMDGNGRWATEKVSLEHTVIRQV